MGNIKVRCDTCGTVFSVDVGARVNVVGWPHHAVNTESECLGTLRYEDTFDLWPTQESTGPGIVKAVRR